MTEVSAPERRPSTWVKRIRAVHFAPVLALIALLAWAFASPVGAGPDDDYHLVSVWCANGGSAQCAPGAQEGTRSVAIGFKEMVCYAQNGEQSAVCQDAMSSGWDAETYETARGNFYGEYPALYYGVMHLFAGPDLQLSALIMRAFNATLFVALTTALFVLLRPTRRRSLLWGWLVVMVPLGMFLVPSNNPSGWAITGVGTAFLALLGWFETRGARRWILGALYLVGMLMAAGSRGDAAVYAAGATVVAVILTASRDRSWLRAGILPIIGIGIAVGFFATAGQAGVGAVGFTGSGDAVSPVPGVETPLNGVGLAAYNLLMLPFLWTGVWGSWGLGWLDTGLPAIVPWAATSAFVVIAFAGIGRLSWRKGIAVTGVLFVLTALPVYVLTTGGDRIGDNLQPRYLLPLIVLFAFALVYERPGVDTLRFGRIQTISIMGALALANLVALQVNIRRYVTGTEQQGLNLDSGSEWWWSGFPLGPTAVWALGAVAYTALLVMLWVQLRRITSPGLRI
jgi:hypothetical protein